MPGDYEYWRAAIEPYDRLAWSDEAAYARLPEAARWLLAMSTVEGQVFNGGFHQVYSNSCDCYLPDALAGYEAIGAAEHASIVRRVMDMVRDDPYAGPRDRWPDPEADEPAPGEPDIGDFDQPWYDLEQTFDLDRAKAQFVHRLGRI